VPLVVPLGKVTTPSVTDAGVTAAVVVTVMFTGLVELSIE
jgi:hypothetical protein